MIHDLKIICHYDEIGLKGKNRPWFEKKLRHSIRFALREVSPGAKIKSLRGRIIVTIKEENVWAEVSERLQDVCGLSYFARVYAAPPTIEEVAEQLKKKLADVEVSSFAVRVKREDKSFALKSPEIERELGGRIFEFKGWKVNLGNPELMINFEWMRDKAWYYFERISGPGGLPVSASGKVLCLLSGGIDSPVASYLMMKRACLVEFIHFHSFPFTNTASQRKVTDLVEKLCRYRCPTRLFLSPFTDLQQEIVVSAPPSYRIILYRRFMMRIAEKIAQREHCQVLITGDSLAQVASQTLENLTTVNAVTTMPVFRPLIGMDKREIIDISRKIGTFDISARPHEDCCSWLMPKNPELHARIQDLAAIEQNLSVDELVEKNIEKITIQSFFRKK